VDVELVDEADAWLCAANNAFIVSGDICAKPLPPVAVFALALVGLEAVLERSNGLLAPWLKPVDCVDDDFDDSRAWRASMADDAAPIAGNIPELRQCRMMRPLFTPISQQALCHGQKPNKIEAFCV
jgi:hypothetical protein